MEGVMILKPQDVLILAKLVVIGCPAQSDSKVDIVGHDPGDDFLLKICELAFENLLDSAMDTYWVQGVNNLMRYGPLPNLPRSFRSNRISKPRLRRTSMRFDMSKKLKKIDVF
jgi:hypothetical protein